MHVLVNQSEGVAEFVENQPLVFVVGVVAAVGVEYEMHRRLLRPGVKTRVGAQKAAEGPEDDLVLGVFLEVDRDIVGPPFDELEHDGCVPAPDRGDFLDLFP